MENKKNIIQKNQKIKNPLSLIMLIIVLVSMGQSVYWQTMPVIGRELGFEVWQINLMVSISASMFLFFTPFWGRLSDKVGRKIILLIGLLGYVFSTLLFCFLAYYGLKGYFTFTILFTILLVARTINSAVAAASRPSTGAYVADITSRENRTAGMGKLGAANNQGTIFGPLLVALVAPALSDINIFSFDLETLARLVPLLIMSILMAISVIFVFLYLPDSQPAADLSNDTQRVVLDKDLKILILGGVLIFIAFATTQSVTAFFIQDKFSYSPLETQVRQAWSLGTLALASILIQLTFVQKFKGSPVRLLKLSVPFFILSALLLIYSPSLSWYLFGMAFMGLGMGLASPGYTASASLKANNTNQGAVIGLAFAAPALGFTIGPLASGFMYEMNPTLPFWFIIPTFLLVYLLTFLISNISTEEETL